MVKAGITVVVGIPTFGMVSNYFAQSRASMQFPLVSAVADHYVKGKPIADARNEIVEEALRQGAQYIFWLDDDVVAPGDAFLKLYRHQKDIVNGVYWSKSNPPMPLLFRGHLKGPYWNWHIGDMIEIDAAGNGLTLVKTDVYRKLKELEPDKPWYSVDYSSFPGVPKGGPNNTEDLYFYWRCREAGYKIWADTSVQAMHYDSSNDVFYTFPPFAPQANPAFTIEEPGEKLIADLGSGPATPYMLDEGKTVTFDIREEVKPDVVCDVRYLPVPDETFDIVYSSHTLEHFGWPHVDKVLKEWSRILKVGGELRLVVPNLRSVGQRLVDDQIVPTDMWVLYGEQEYPKNFHVSGFTPSLLKSLVESMGCYDDIQTKEGDLTAPPGGDNWNLQLKATKVKSQMISDNIAPADTEVVEGRTQLWRMRVYENPKEQTAEELLGDAAWLNFPDTVNEQAAFIIDNANAVLAANKKEKKVALPVHDRIVKVEPSDLKVEEMQPIATAYSVQPTKKGRG